MYLPKPQKNKFTVGKYLRAEKRLRKKDPQAKVIQMPLQLKQYVEQLKKKGMNIKNLEYALFYTKNGLPYPGLLAKQKILSNTIMLRLPVECLLTTKIAFFSDIQIVFEENPKFFSKKFTTDWEDHILLAYLLYQNQKGPKSQWYNLIRNLPKDIDYAIFWDKKQLQVMQDKWMQLGIYQQKANFQQQVKQFTQICKKYPQYFKSQSYSYQNIKWIQSHLVTRCFGKYFEYTTMVPFAELFNHQCVDVYYSMDYKPGNPHTQNQEFYDEKDLTNEEETQIQTSDGSYDAEDFYQDEEFFDDAQQQLNNIPPTFNQNINQAISKDIKSIKSYILTFINFNDSVSLPYLIQIFRQLEKIADSEEQKYDQIQLKKQKLKQIHTLNVKYVKAIKQFYSDLKSKQYVYGIKQKKKKEINSNLQPVPGEYYFNTNWSQDKFDDFVMLCSTKDQFQQGSQVYFCYGRLPNKLLMLRYGISLEYNKYNHLFIRLNVEQEVNNVKSLKTVLDYEVNMRRYKRFKLKRTKFCVQFLTYIRAKKWRFLQNVESIFTIKDLNKELLILDESRQLFIDQLNQYQFSLQKNRQKLTDKSLNYHEYFCLVYKIENQQILHWHVKMIDYAKEIINKYESLNEKKQLKEILNEEKNKEKLMMQIMMEGYFKSFTV